MESNAKMANFVLFFHQLKGKLLLQIRRRDEAKPKDILFRDGDLSGPEIDMGRYITEYDSGKFEAHEH